MLNIDALNQTQRAAVLHGEGPLLVLAGPGSGKTFTITQRILYLIEVLQVPPHKILVITFTKEAALSMQRRFREQSNRIYPVNFGTFHSVFYQILRRSGTSRSRKLLGESQKKNLILPILRKYNMESESLEFLSAISFYKNTEEEQQAMLKISAERRTFFTEIFACYENARKQQGAIDFDDMVYECAGLLEQNSQARAYWSCRFSHILMDEFQDINPMQYKVIRLLGAKPYNLFAVGDDDQSIYGFRGSRPACMQQFVKDYGAKKLLLDINYRSYPSIVEASSKVIGENKERFSKELKPCSERMEEWLEYEQEEKLAREKNIRSMSTVAGVKLIHFMELEEQYTYLADKLKSKEENATCAVLFRTNMRLQSFAARLNRLGIPYEMKEKTVSIYEHFVVKDIMAYLRLAAGEQSRELYLRILNKPARGLSREVVSANAGGDILLEKQLAYIKKISLYLGVQYICKVVGYERYLEAESRKHSGSKERLEEWKEILEWIKEDAKGYENVSDWLEAQRGYKEKLNDGENCAEGKTTTEQGRDDKLLNEQGIPKVQLMTVHASKGLEFDHVYIPDCNEKNFPHGSMLDQEACEEERRIFYVAMTRARKSLELLYLTGTKERPRLPSRFLNPLLKKDN